MEEDEPPIEEEEEPTSEFVDGLELLFGRGKSGYKDVYPHRKGWQAKVTVEGKGVCSLGVFKDKRSAAVAVARAKARGLHLLNSPDKTRAKPGFGVKRKLPSITPTSLPIYSMASIENSSLQIAPVPVQPLGSAACLQACMAGMPAALAQPVVAPGPIQPTDSSQASFPMGVAS